jgi:hypothetical protein
MADQPIVAHGYENVSVAPVVVEADLGEDREVAGDSRLVWAYFGEADVRDVVAHDPLNSRCLRGRNRWCDDATQEVDDRGPPAYAFAAAKLQLAVLAETLSKVVESQRVARPVVAGQCVPDAFTGRQLPKLHDANRKPGGTPARRAGGLRSRNGYQRLP